MTMRIRSSLIVAGVAAVTACARDDGRKGDDTLAVPAGAVDTAAAVQGSATVRAGTPGAGTAQSGAPKATGVDTPITRKLRAEDSARSARDTTR